MRILFEKNDFRIIEMPDESALMNYLKGDCFSLVANPDVDPKELKKQERAFEALVNDEGVFGYCLEKWNPAVGIGWEHVDSCWGFVGQYSESDDKFKHYIVEELKGQIV